MNQPLTRTPRWRIIWLCAVMSMILWACEDARSKASVMQPESSEARGDVAAIAEARAEATLSFSRDGEEVDQRTLAEMAEAHGVEEWEAFDPYYQRVKRWRTVPLEPVLTEVFGEDDTLREREFLLRAEDGYKVPISGEKLLGDKGPYLAFRDRDHPDWEPIGPQQADPGPFYLVWRGAEQQDREAYPRPWQLAEIEIATFEDVFPRTVPVNSAPRSAARKGFAIYKEQCVRCHAINQQGGHVGPELNVPQNITEYRPEAQIRAYIKNPRTFRYGNMPPFPHLTEEDLDHIIAYFVAMRDLKQDPHAEEEL